MTHYLLDQAVLQDAVANAYDAWQANDNPVTNEQLKANWLRAYNKLEASKDKNY